MAVVFIPSLMRSITGGQDRIQVKGSTIRAIVKNLDAAYPGFNDRLMSDGKLKPSFTVAIDGEVSQLGALEKVGVDSEVHFLNAISGG